MTPARTTPELVARCALVFALGALSACSKSGEAERKALEMCALGQLERVNLKALPGSITPEHYIASADLEYARAQDAREAKGAFAGLAAAMESKAPMIAEVLSEYASCKVTARSTSADGEQWTFTLENTEPDIKHDNPLAAMGALMGAPDKAAMKAIVDGWVEGAAGATKTSTHEVELKRQGEHVVLVYGLEARAAAREKEAELALIAEQLDEVSTELAAAKAARAKLDAFTVSSASFTQKRMAYSSRKRATIELTVKNGLEQAVSRAYFVGTLASPGRSIPWVKEGFNYEISGGIEPGEEMTWKLAPNMFDAWGSADPDDDAVLSVVVVGLDGKGGTEIARMPSKRVGIDSTYLTVEDLAKTVEELSAKRDALK